MQHKSIISGNLQKHIPKLSDEKPNKNSLVVKTHISWIVQNDFALNLHPKKMTKLN
jgi:hypothetical protein